MPVRHGIAAYDAEQIPAHRRICTALADAIDAGLPGAEGKIWHRHPVWFLDGNPIVGYSKLQDTIRLMFWSGQSFDEPGLSPEPPGTRFKTARRPFHARRRDRPRRPAPLAREIHRDPVGLQEPREAKGQARAAEMSGAGAARSAERQPGRRSDEAEPQHSCCASASSPNRAGGIRTHDLLTPSQTR
jgi:hypothetical protein